MDEPEYSAVNIEKALNQLYFDPIASNKDIAQRWLTKAQRASEAWVFAWALLEDGKATEVQYFGASSLVSKISISWNDIPIEDVWQLREKLFEQILRFCTLPEKRIVLTKLCVAFASFVINCAARNLWSSAVTDIMKRLQSTDNKASEGHRITGLLEILTVLPEECQTTHGDKHKRGILMHFLRSGAKDVLNLLFALFQIQSVKALVIKCLSSWISVGIPLCDCEELLICVLECVKVPDLFEQSVECMLNVFCSPPLCEYPSTVKKFISSILPFQSVLHSAIKDRDADCILGLTKLICSLAENQTKVIVQCIHDESCVSLIYLVMECSSIPLQYPVDEVSSPISFTFWYSLQDELQALDDDHVQIRNEVTPVFYNLLSVLLQKATYPADNSFDTWSAEEKEQHRIYRVDISDTLMYFIDMLGLTVLEFLYARFEACLQETLAKPATSWQSTEACLFGIYSIVETLTEMDVEIPCVASLAQVLPRIPIHSVQLADTIVYTVGTLTEWLSTHTEHIQMLLQIVLPCISNPDLALSAVLTLRRLARECSVFMAAYAGSIVEQISKIFIQGILRDNEESWLMQSAGYLLSVLPEKEYIGQIANLLVLHIHQLDALSKETPSPPNRNGILRILNLLSNLFSSLDRRKKDEEGRIIGNSDSNLHVIETLTKLMPVFREILNRWLTDATIVQTICYVYDRSIRCLVDAFSPLLQQVCEMLVTIYQTHPYIFVLDLAQQIVLVFGSDPQQKRVVVSMLQAFIATSAKLYENGLVSQHPDIAQGFMNLLSQVCRKQAKFFTQNDENYQFDLFNLLRCGILTLHLPDSESARAGAGFVIDLINLYSASSNIASAVEKAGKELLTVSLKAIGGDSPRTCMDHFADILFVVCRTTFTSYIDWLKELFDQPGIPCDSVNAAQKVQFHRRLLRDIKNKRKYRDLIKEFSLVCRGLHGTEYASG